MWLKPGGCRAALAVHKSYTHPKMTSADRNYHRLFLGWLGPNSVVGYCGLAILLHVRGVTVLILSRRPVIQTTFLSFPPSLMQNVGMASRNRPRQHPSTFFIIHHSQLSCRSIYIMYRSKGRKARAST